MSKRLLSLFLAILWLFTAALPIHAENIYNDTTIEWGEHTTHVYDDCGDLSCNICGALRNSDHVYDSPCDGVCNYCGHVRPIPGHQYDHGCDPSCNLCGATRPVQHKYSNACDKTCDICGFIRETAHDYAAATCTTPKTCTICGETEGEALGHTPGAAADCENPQVCTVCGDQLVAALGHDYKAVVTAPTCDNGGYTIYTCAVCGDHYRTDETAALGHDYQAVVTAPTCDNGGYTTYTCAVCGDHYRTDETAALGHDYQAVVTAPTCGNGGYTTYTCAVCGDGYIADETAALGHTPGAAADCENPQVCTVCGDQLAAALGHDYKTVVTAPTCDNGGYATYTCAVCGDHYRADETPAVGHDYDSICDGECNVCGATRPVPGHVYSNACDVYCDNCGAPRDVGDHIWGEGVCAECGAASPTKATITATSATARYAKEGAKVSAKVTAEGEGLTYVWYFRSATGKTYSKSSVKSATYSTTMSDKANGRRIYCVVTDQYGNRVQSKTFMLREQVSLVSVPATARYAKEGAKVSVKINASGDGLKYTWYFRNATGSKYSKSSVTSATYTTTMSDKVKGRRVYCVVTDKYGKKVTSKTFLLREQVSIITQPKTVMVAKNKTAKVSVKASGDGLKYTWYIKNAGASKYSKSSVKSATYSVKMSDKVKNRLLYCVVTDQYGKTVKTVTVRLKMK